MHALHDQRQLTVELEAVALRALVGTWHSLNATYFMNSLRRPVFELSGSIAALGRWTLASRTLEISRQLLLEHGWGAVVEVLKHEMAHQFVDEVLGRHGETAHGPAFREVCRQRGFDERASGVPANEEVSEAHAKVLNRVSKLLALAQSQNENEAHAAALAAQRLMLKYNIQSVEDSRPRRYQFRHLGKPSGRVSEAERTLAVILGDHFFVETIWVPVWRPSEGKRGSVLEVCGTPENVELAAYTHSFLSHTAERLWRDFKRSRRMTSNAGRRSFVAGVVAGFREKLDRQKAHNDEQGLVWLGDPELKSYFRQRHPHVRWTRHAASHDRATYAHGREAGRKLVLHRGVQAGPTTESRLLPRGGS